MNYIPAKKNESDARLVMNWRNDPDTRRFSFNSQPKKWEDFQKEYNETYFPKNSIPPHFGIIPESGEKAVFLRSLTYCYKTDLQNCFDISINVGPEFRGKGLGQKALRDFSKLIFNFGAKYIIAEIKIENITSQLAFLKAGFQEYDQIIKEKYDQEFSIKRFIKREQ